MSGASAVKTPARLGAAKAAGAATPGSARTLMAGLALSGGTSILKALGTGTNMTDLASLLDPKVRGARARCRSSRAAGGGGRRRRLVACCSRAARVRRAGPALALPPHRPPCAQEVSFALVKIPIGTGTFSRHKVVLCVRRARARALSSFSRARLHSGYFVRPSFNRR